MSLKPFSTCVVPERTASVARAAFPKGSLCIRIFDELGTIFQDQDFADLHSQHGQPGQQPFRLALVTVLQFIEGLISQGVRAFGLRRLRYEGRNAGIDISLMIA
jgi:transposase